MRHHTFLVKPCSRGRHNVYNLIFQVSGGMDRADILQCQFLVWLKEFSDVNV